MSLRMSRLPCRSRSGKCRGDAYVARARRRRCKCGHAARERRVYDRVPVRRLAALRVTRQWPARRSSYGPLTRRCYRRRASGGEGGAGACRPRETDCPMLWFPRADRAGSSRAGLNARRPRATAVSAAPHSSRVVVAASGGVICNGAICRVGRTAAPQRRASAAAAAEAVWPATPVSVACVELRMCELTIERPSRD